MSKDHQEYDLTSNIQDVLNILQTPGDSGENTEPDDEALETIHVYPVEGGGILFTRTPIETDEDLDTAPIGTPQPSQPASNAATGIVPFGVFATLLCLFCIAAQFYLIINPLIVTVTLLARSQQLTVNGTLQLGSVLNPITISQSSTVPTTGKGHQDAKQATGNITFYNGQLTSVFVPAGTILTSNGGEPIITDADADIPAGNPPTYGQMTVPAHVTNPGSQGNVAAYDINQGCCAPAIKVVNTSSFSGGQDERNFQTVTKSDIANAATPLKATVSQSVEGALQGQLKQGEQLQRLPCSPTVTPDHQIGQEATTVKVTVSETCSGIAYNSQELTSKVTRLLTTQAATKLGARYSLLETPQITVTGATTAKQVTLSFSSVSIWVHTLSSAEQHNIKASIAGKNTQQAMQVLRSLPGIENTSLQFSGFGDATRIPKNISTIHLMLSIPVYRTEDI